MATMAPVQNNINYNIAKKTTEIRLKFILIELMGALNCLLGHSLKPA